MGSLNRRVRRLEERHEGAGDPEERELAAEETRVALRADLRRAWQLAKWEADAGDSRRLRALEELEGYMGARRAEAPE